MIIKQVYTGDYMQLVVKLRPTVWLNLGYHYDFGHVVRMEDKRLPAKALYCYVDGKRSRETQTKTWMDNVRQDLAEKTWPWEFIIDSGRWRNLVKTLSSMNAWRRRKEEEEGEEEEKEKEEEEEGSHLVQVNLAIILHVV